jgi:hypothetical protein
MSSAQLTATLKDLRAEIYALVNIRSCLEHLSQAYNRVDNKMVQYLRKYDIAWEEYHYRDAHNRL